MADNTNNHSLDPLKLKNDNWSKALKDRLAVLNERTGEMRLDAVRSFEIVENRLCSDPSFGRLPDPWARKFVEEDPETAAVFAFELIMLLTMVDAYWTPVEEDGQDWRGRVCRAMQTWVDRWEADVVLPYHINTLLWSNLFNTPRGASDGAQSGIGESENQFRRKIINHFGDLFPELDFKEIEKPTRNGRIDIYAEAKTDRRPVLMELKIDGKNPTGQLLEYALDFKSPRLIAITRKPVDKAARVKGVEYFTYGNGRLSSEEPA